MGNNYIDGDEDTSVKLSIPVMEDSTETETEPPTAQIAPNMFSGKSIVDLLNEEAAEISNIKFVHIPILGYEKTGLTARYHMPENGKELEKINRKAEREFKDTYSRSLTSSLDTMIHLCDGLYVNPNNDPEPVELDPDMIGYPVRFDERCAEIFGWAEPGMTARTVVKRLFNGNDLAILSHGEKLSRWLHNAKADVTRELWQELGE